MYVKTTCINESTTETPTLETNLDLALVDTSIEEMTPDLSRQHM